jgi:hypothetical protein
MQTENRGKGPLAGWRASFQETTDTFDIGTFLETDGPTAPQEVVDLRRAVTEGGTFGNYRRVASDHADGYNFFVMGPNSILNAKKEDHLLAALDAIDQANPSSKPAED